MVRVVLHTALYATLAVALPWFVFVPIAVALAAADVAWTGHRISRRYQSVLDDLHSVHGESIGRFSDIQGSAIEEGIFRAFRELATGLQSHLVTGIGAVVLNVLHLPRDAAPLVAPGELTVTEVDLLRADRERARLSGETRGDPGREDV